ncbi:MAG: HigA family addiction module antitoxin [Bryobacteraceae bacterium]
MAQRKKLPPIHPGELLRDELNEIGISLNELGRALRVPMNRISAIVNGKRAITVDTAMRLARYFGTSPQDWLNLQTAYDLEIAAREIRPKIEREVLPRKPLVGPRSPCIGAHVPSCATQPLSSPAPITRSPSIPKPMFQLGLRPFPALPAPLFPPSVSQYA